MVMSLSSITLLILALRIGLWCVCSHWLCHSGECISTAPYRWLWSSAWVFVDWRKLHFESANITGLAINISLLLLLQHLFSSAYCLLLWVSALCSWARRCASLLLPLQRHSLFDSGLFEPLSEVNFRLYLQQTECLSKCHCGLLKWSFANLSSYLLRLSRLHVRKHLAIVMNLSEDPYC